VVEQITLQAKQVAARYGRPIDMEWVFDGQTVYWVQLREVTALDIPVYSNHISREVFPGLIKPLVWSVNVPLVNGAWVNLFTELIGPNDIEPDSLARSFFYRACFDMGAIGRIFELMGFPRESLELLMGLDSGGPDKPSFKPSPRTYALLPRMLWFIAGKLAFASRVERYLSTARSNFDKMRAAPLASMTDEQMLAHIDRLFELVQETAYYNIVTPLLMQVYHRVLFSEFRRVGIDPQTVDVLAGLDAYRDYEPYEHLAELSELFLALDRDAQSLLRQEGYRAIGKLKGAQAFRKGMEKFVAQFGHLSDSGNDFSVVPWREDPDAVLNMVITYEQRETPRPGTRFADLNPPFVCRLLLTPIYRRARHFQLLREAGGSTYTFGYGLFRDAFLALGARLLARGAIGEKDDVLYLTCDEVKQLSTRANLADELESSIAARKREMEAYRDIVPPSLIFGDEAAPISPDSPDKLKGTPTSRGRYTGPVRTVHGIAELNRVEKGDVLVVPYSDVGWTPLFCSSGRGGCRIGGHSVTQLDHCTRVWHSSGGGGRRRQPIVGWHNSDGGWLRR
jgi:pyruvate,water dikinase